MTATASASSATTTSTTPLGACTETGPISSGANSPSPPPAIMAGPPMPSDASCVATIRSAQPAITALPAKQLPLTTAMRGTRPDSLAHRAKARTCSADTTGMSVSPGRPPPPSAKKTAGSRRRSMSSNSRSFLWCPTAPCVPASTM